MRGKGNHNQRIIRYECSTYSYHVLVIVVFVAVFVAAAVVVAVVVAVIVADVVVVTVVVIANPSMLWLASMLLSPMSLLTSIQLLL